MDKKLTCCGDEPYTDFEEVYAKGSEWLLHEAFCLYGQADRFHPYEHHHSTVRESCQLAEKLGVKNLILYHTEDVNIARRKELYEEEGKTFYHGNLLVPDDLTTIDLSMEEYFVHSPFSGKEEKQGPDKSQAGPKRRRRRKHLRTFFR